MGLTELSQTSGACSDLNLPAWQSWICLVYLFMYLEWIAFGQRDGVPIAHALGIPLRFGAQRGVYAMRLIFASKAKLISMGVLPVMLPLMLSKKGRKCTKTLQD